ncbi:MAG: secretin N-terminal domain-containing protein, partial [Pirellulales bacterium]
MVRSRKSRKAFGGALLVALAASTAPAQQPLQIPPVPVTGQALPSTQLGVPPAAPAFTSPTGTTSGQLGASNLQGAGSILAYEIPKEMVGAVASRLSLTYSNEPGFRATSEPGTGRLLVFATAKTHQEINSRLTALVQEIAKQGNGSIPSVQMQTYTLRYIAANELEDAIRRLGGPRLTVNTINNGEVAQIKLPSDSTSQQLLQIDRKKKIVSLQGTTSNVHAWLQVITAIDNGAATPELPTQIVPLAPADPAKVENTYRLVRAALQQSQQPQQGQDESVTEQRNVGQQAPGTIGIQGLAEGVEGGLFGDVQIEFVQELGIVIVKGRREDVRRVLDVIDKIKKQSEQNAPTAEVYALKHVDSQALQTIIRDLYDNVLAPRQGQVSITALGQPNALLLIGQKEAIKTLTELLDKLDQPLNPSDQLKVIHLVHASSVDAETILRDFFVDRPGQNQTERTALGTRVKVSSDRRTNLLIIQASPDMAEVEKLIAQIDVESTPLRMTRVFPWQTHWRTELAPVLQTAITGTSSGTGAQGAGGGGGQATGGATATAGNTPLSAKITIVGKAGQTDSGILSGVVVTSNPAINALVVRAPSKSMTLIAELIRQLDQAPNAQAQIKVFEIKNGDATLLTNELQQLFGLAATAGTNQNAGGGLGGLFGLGGQNLAALTGGGDGGIVQLRLTVDTRTNSIIASGSKNDLEVIEVLLMRLDEEGAQNRKTEVIWLRNSNAQDLATAIQNLITQQRQTITQVQITGQSIGAFEQIDREVIVVAEPTTNSLIVSATPRFSKQIREVIERLDRRPPLIMVQILLAEVSLTDDLELGTELGLQDALNFDRGSASRGTLSSPGFNVNTPPGNGVTAGRPGNVAGQGLSSFGMGRASSSLSYGGMVLAAASDSVNVLVRALQDAGRLQILSRPQVMTIDNVEAFVQVGARVPRVTGINQNTIGSQIVTQDTDVGLLMRLQPRTNQDGLILMNVSVERSSVGDEAEGIPVGFGPNGEVIRSPLINRTLAQTRVTALDGQTVCFAGLITKTRQTKSRRIPFLADIPIAGALFRFDSESEARTELLVVMTPHIVRTPEEMQMIVDVESSRMSWCLADVLNIHGDTNLSAGNGLWGPASSPIIYPDISPTIELPGQSLMIEGQYPQGYDPNLPVMTAPPGSIPLQMPAAQPT